MIHKIYSLSIENKADFVAFLGGRWRPKSKELDSDLKSKHTHWDPGLMFEEKALNNVSASSFLLNLIKEFLV